jgi:hypothetical protein
LKVTQTIKSCGTCCKQSHSSAGLDQKRFEVHGCYSDEATVHLDNLTFVGIGHCGLASVSEEGCGADVDSVAQGNRVS